ncbi:MAG: insulinase family protein [Myxococcales bacterium]|nr:insulinase family protein [Myxococcales bacterium]
MTNLNEIELVERVPFGTARGTAPVEKYRLPNGLTVIIFEDHRAPVFSYHTWFKVGSRHEKPGKTGIAHLFEHLMFKETINTPEGEFDRLMEHAGAQTNAATWTDWTYYYEKLPTKHLELPFRLEADRMEHMVLGTHQLESEREVVINERSYRVDNDPEGKIYEVLYANAFGSNHPYGWPTIGWMDDIRSIQLADCMEFYGKYYAPNNATIVVTGDVDTSVVLNLIHRYYGHMKPQEISEAEVPPVVLQGEQRLEIELQLASDRLLIGYMCPSIRDSRTFSLSVLNEILFNGDSSRVTKRLVFDDELATDVHAWPASFRFSGLFQIDVTMKPGVSAEAALAVIDEEIHRLVTAGITDRELQKAYNTLEADTVRHLLSCNSVANAFGLYESTTGHFSDVFHLNENTRKVTASDVVETAKHLLADAGRVVLFARPSGELADDNKETSDEDFDE